MFRRIFISEKGFTVFSLILALSLVLTGTIISHRHFDSIGVPWNPEMVTEAPNNVQSETIVEADEIETDAAEPITGEAPVDTASLEDLVESLKVSNIAFTDGNQLTSSEAVGGSVANSTIYVTSIGKDDLNGADPQAVSDAILTQLPERQYYNIAILTVKDGDTLYNYASSQRSNIPIRTIQLLGETTTDMSGADIVKNMPNFKIIVDPAIYTVEGAKPKTQEAPKPPKAPTNWGIVLTYFLSFLSTAVVIGSFATSRVYGAELADNVRKGKRAPNIQNKNKLTKKLARSIDSITELSNNELGNYPVANEKVIKTLGLFNELMEAMDFANVDDHKRRLVYIEYENIMNKLAIILSGKYYLDLKKNPHHWDNVEEKIDAVETTIDVVQEQIITTIKQIKSGTEIKIQSSIDSILGFKVDGYSEMLKPKENTVEKKRNRNR